jgi:tetratricopeptide (TPR) repeat protein
VPASLRARASLSLGFYELVRTFDDPDVYESVRQRCEESLIAARELDDRYLVAQTLYLLSLAEVRLKRFEDSLDHANESLVLARQAGDPWLEGCALNGLAFVEGQFNQDNMIAAMTSAASRVRHREALDCFRRVGDMARACDELFLIASNGFENEQAVREAVALLKEAETIAEENGSILHLSLVWANLGVAASVLDEFADAELYSRRSLHWVRRLGRPPSNMAMAALGISHCAAARGDFVLAAQLAGAAQTYNPDDIASDAVYWTPMERKTRDENVKHLKEALGEKDFQRAFEIGAAMSVDQMLDLALEVSSAS